MWSWIQAPRLSPCNPRGCPQLRQDARLLAAALLLAAVHNLCAQAGFVNYTVANEINALALEADSILWAGTAGGVVRWNLADGSYAKFTTADGLADNYAIAADPQGGVWFGTLKGVSRFDGSEWTQ